MLTVRGLEAGYGARPVLHGVEFDVAPGEIVALLGRNGSGRSTTAKALMGLLPARGSVRWNGVELLGRPAHQIARAGLGYVPESRDVFPTLSVAENLRLGERPRPGTRRWTTAELLARFPRLAERAQAPAGVLSGGEQQMLTLARTLVGDPALLIVDEPTEGLAPQVVTQVAELLAEARRRGVGVLLVEQKLAIALQLADRCLVMGRGRIVFAGTPGALAADAGVRREWLEV
ncbi:MULTISPECIES: ABC transporter ATP-binding protein [unclassified Rubrivivax]|uniref:ABC transporter ATP-binding protein n=1 Tax=unclassified Rubrivivax TaxID=2649762 RepID=UPI001E4593D5|nr:MULTISPECIES: ABC transporter ATP-binding protein [unclassified Rubrivivax]MCC9597507.1 ABC transporter ATP-binding protein [Rubrivivax sp. JA1055]MCC9646235.1 ABC transporter ATP-binding protein [Rubrivivax sp. JA1029]